MRLPNLKLGLESSNGDPLALRSSALIYLQSTRDELARSTRFCPVQARKHHRRHFMTLKILCRRDVVIVRNRLLPVT